MRWPTSPPAEIRYLLSLAAELKAAKLGGFETPRLCGKNIALIFEKTSTRTCAAFEVAAFDQRANVSYLGPSGTQLGHKETVEDTARVALGGNALLRRGEALTVENQRQRARIAAAALAPLALEHELVITHGNGPQVGLLALQAEAYKPDEAYPLDVLGAESEGMVGYLIEQELGNALAPGTPLATLLTMVDVDADDPAFDKSAKFIGPVYDAAQATGLRQARGWPMARDGQHWRRVVPSPRPRRIVEIEPLRVLLDAQCVVICAGGGGIPTIVDGAGQRHGTEAVIDKDFTSELLAREVQADWFVMLTDVDAIYRDWGTPHAQPIRQITPQALIAHEFSAGSMGPKVEAACRFASEMGKPASVGSLDAITEIVAGRAGTTVQAECADP